MKNTFFATFALTILLVVGLGCGSINPFAEESKSANGRTNTNANTGANQSLTDQGIDTVVGEQKIGIPECDEVMDLLSAELNNPDDGYIVKAGKALVVNQIRDSIKRSIEENQGDKPAIAKTCSEAKVELEKAKKAQGAK